MNIENHVPTLETCKKIQEAGWKNKWESPLYWIIHKEDGIQLLFRDDFDTGCLEEYYPAPLLSELLEELYNLNMFPYVESTKYGGSALYLATANIYKGIEKVKDRTQYHQNPAEAAAQLVLTLVEEGVFTL